MTRPTATRVRYWDRKAASYDAGMASLERRFFADSRPWICSRARGATLELAIGTGANLDHYPGAVDLTGVDCSSEMLKLAQERADRTRRPVRLQQADAGSLPFSAEAFDTVVSTFALCCVPDPRRALDEAVRVLRPGGRLLLLDHVVSTSWPIRVLQHGLDLVTVPLQGEHFTRRPAAILAELDVIVEEDDRLSRGVVERVQARKRS